MKKKLSVISAWHYAKLVTRSLFFLLALVLYIINRVQKTGDFFFDVEYEKWILGILFLIYAIEMILRFFPSKTESMGCQKQFKRNFKPTNETVPDKQHWSKTFLVLLSWILLNGVFGVLYYTHIIDQGILVLISFAYGICDMICILFFCPFQTWMMKNRCCTTCRIYNWDFAMMFTPFIFIPHLFTWGLLGISLILVARWEITYRIWPERFYDNTNESVKCANCEEKLCHHKKQLQKFIKKLNVLKKQK